MRWAVQVSVALVNIVWILFFFTTDDSSVTVWRRSAEEEELIGEFCLQLPHVDVSLNQSSSTVTSEENKTLKAQTSKPEAETPIMDDYETTSRPPDPDLTSTGVVSTESSAPFRVAVNNKPKEDYTPESLSSRANGLENCCFKFYPRRMSKDKIVSYSMTDDRCPKIGVILQTLKSKKVCADPNLSWVEGIMRHVNEKSF